MARSASAWVARAGLVAAFVLIGALPALGAELSEKLAPCLSCHGTEGQSQTENVPSLGAQTPSYSLIQLFMFREKLRRNDIMNDAVKGFSDDDLPTFSDLIARLPSPTPPAEPADVPRLEKGRALIRMHRCDVCYNPDLAGRDNVPRIAGQREDFLVKTLREYKANTRPGYDASMGDVVQRISDAEIADLAFFAAQQR